MKNTIVTFELQSPVTYPIYGNLLYLLGDQLVVTDKRVNRWYRQYDENGELKSDIIRIEFESSGDKYHDLALLLNALRLNKNEVAHQCYITRI